MNDTARTPPTRRALLGLAALAALAAAACLSAPPAEVSGGEIRNRTRAVLQDVRVVHAPGGVTAAVSEVPPGQAFELGLPPRPLQARSATLSWRTAGGEAREVEVELPCPPAELADLRLWIVYTIRPGGAVEVSFEPAPMLRF